MNKMEQVRDGLTLLLGYGGELVDAQHDELFAGGAPPDQMLPEHAAKLGELGWRYDDSNESWVVFT